MSHPHLTGDWALLANLHRPADPTAEIRRLATTGLTARDIAAALRLPLGAVLQALRQPTPSIERKFL